MDLYKGIDYDLFVDQYTTLRKTGEYLTSPHTILRACTFSPSCLMTLVFHKITGKMEGLVCTRLYSNQQVWEGTYVKFRWKPTCGVKSLLEDEAIKVGGSNQSCHTGSLRIHHGWKLPPSRKLFIQIMDLADEDKFDFDPLNVTKTWPEGICPL